MRPFASHWQTIALGAGFAALFALLARDTLHPPDAPRFIAMVHTGDLVEYHHFGYLAAADLAAALLRPLGLSTFESMRALSAFCGGLAVAFAHRAFECSGVDRARAASGAALVGSCPALVYYATTVEIHAVHLAASALAFWSAAANARTMRNDAASSTAVILGIARTGLLSGLAATVHASGQMLPFVLAPILLQRSARRSAAAIAVLLAGHVLASIAIVALVRPNALAVQSDYFATFLREPIALPVAAGTFWREWLVAFSPVVWLGLLATCRGPDRRAARILHLAFVPYLVATVAILRGVRDHGSYLLPLALPLAWLGTRLAPPSLTPGLAAIGLLIGCWSLPSTAGLAAQRAFSEQLVALDAETPVAVFGVTEEIDAVARWSPGIPADNVLAMHALRGFPRASLPALTAAFDERVRQSLAAGRVPLLTGAAARWLRSAPGDLLWTLATEHLQERHDLESVARGELHGWLLRPRSPK